MKLARMIVSLLVLGIGLALSSCVVYDDDDGGWHHRGGWHEHEHEHWR